MWYPSWGLCCVLFLDVYVVHEMLTHTHVSHPAQAGLPRFSPLVLPFRRSTQPESVRIVRKEFPSKALRRPEHGTLGQQQLCSYCLLFPSNLLKGLCLIKVLSDCAAQQSRPRQPAQSDCGTSAGWCCILVDMIIAGSTIYADTPCATFSLIGSISCMSLACCISEAMPDSDAAAAQHIENRMNTAIKRV